MTVSQGCSFSSLSVYQTDLSNPHKIKGEDSSFSGVVFSIFIYIAALRELKIKFREIKPSFAAILF